ncbi:kinase-like domain-containing protein [Mycena capillaripes]|nr:kinase-like domain-containing protein [Mycena capillaripes]
MYSSGVVSTLLRLVKQFCEKDPRARNVIAKDVHMHIERDILALVTPLILLLRTDRNSETYRNLLACRETTAQQLLDLLQDLLVHEAFSVVKPSLFKALTRLSRASELFPTCLPLPELQTVGKQPVAGGGFGDVYQGLVQGQSVCVKVMRLFRIQDIQVVLKQFGQEGLIWRQLCHPNVLPFFGVYYWDSRLCLVSPWMANGNTMEYLGKALPGTDRFPMILDVALGLTYLHENHVVHGDLKAINILVTPSHRACIADFGLSSMVESVLRFSDSTRMQGGTVRYQAPELIREERGNHFGSDVYAFACVCYEILTGKLPFYELRNVNNVSLKVLEGSRPSRPASCMGTPALDALWDLLQDCWRGNPDTRPTAASIVERLVGPLIQAKTTESLTDWDEKFSSRFRRSLQVKPLFPSVSEIENMIAGDAGRTERSSDQELPGRPTSPEQGESDT